MSPYVFAVTTAQGLFSLSLAVLACPILLHGALQYVVRLATGIGVGRTTRFGLHAHPRCSQSLPRARRRRHITRYVQYYNLVYLIYFNIFFRTRTTPAFRAVSLYLELGDPSARSASTMHLPCYGSKNSPSSTLHTNHRAHTMYVRH